MGEDRAWYLVCYDIRDPKRWRLVFKLLKGYGHNLQYSIFRCRLTKRQSEQLRWELATLLDPVDSLMVASLCPDCASRLEIQGDGQRNDWTCEHEKFKVL